MPIPLAAAALILIATRCSATCGEITSCSSVGLNGFVKLRGDGTLWTPDGPFKFTSVNLPNLHRIEIGEEEVREPTAWEIADSLCAVQQMGGKAARIYVLSHGEDDSFHINVGGILNEKWFRVLDQVLFVAGELGIRLIIPFINTVWCAADRPLSAPHSPHPLSAPSRAGSSGGARAPTMPSGSEASEPPKTTFSTRRTSALCSRMSCAACLSAGLEASLLWNRKNRIRKPAFIYFSPSCWSAGTR